MRTQTTLPRDAEGDERRRKVLAPQQTTYSGEWFVSWSALLTISDGRRSAFITTAEAKLRRRMRHFSPVLAAFNNVQRAHACSIQVSVEPMVPRFFETGARAIGEHRTPSDDLRQVRRHSVHRYNHEY